MRRGAFILCLLLAACGGRQAANNAVAVEQPAPAAVPTPAPARPAPTADPNAELDIRTMLDRIYAPYASANAPGTDLSQYMEPELAAAMRSGRGGVDADPFIDAQDYQPFRPTFGPIRFLGDTAETDVEIVSLGRRSIHYGFVRTRAGWKISEIRGPSSGSLRMHYGLDPRP